MFLHVDFGINPEAGTNVTVLESKIYNEICFLGMYVYLAVY